MRGRRRVCALLLLGTPTALSYHAVDKPCPMGSSGLLAVQPADDGMDNCTDASCGRKLTPAAVQAWTEESEREARAEVKEAEEAKAAVAKAAEAKAAEEAAAAEAAAAETKVVVRPPPPSPSGRAAQWEEYVVQYAFDAQATIAHQALTLALTLILTLAPNPHPRPYPHPRPSPSPSPSPSPGQGRALTPSRGEGPCER